MMETMDNLTREEPATTLAGSPDLNQVVNEQEGAWLKFRAQLRPRYGLALAELSLCILMLLGAITGFLWFERAMGHKFAFAISPLLAVWIGFWLNALLCFGHEAAHYNLWRQRQVNDRIADWSIWLFFPESTKSYRRSHWQHHLHLGESEDTEISYRNCLSPWFLAKTLAGIYLVELLFRYMFGRGSPGVTKSSNQDQKPAPGFERPVLPILRTAITHLGFLGAALALGCYAAALAWAMGAVLVFPAIGSVRQILEHRSADAACSVELGDAGIAVNRIFGSGLFSRYFGAAGFNRHLLHHWDPTVSYTQFDEMLRFFKGTALAPRLQASTTKYASSFWLLVKRARHDS